MKETCPRILPFWKHTMDLSVSVLTVLVLVFFSLGLAKSMGLAVADDSYCALAAQNLARGYGYSMPGPLIGDPEKRVLFATEISTGPAVVIPIAIAIRIFGDSDVIPGMASVILWAVILTGFMIILYRKPRQWFFFPVSAVLFLGFAGVFGNHIGQWTTLLGEVPAALFAVTGMALLAKHKPSKTGLLLAGFFFGLAVASKFIVWLAVPAIYLTYFMSYKRVLSKEGFKLMLAEVLILTAGIIIPTFLFEIWKMFNLGFYEYISKCHHYFTYVKTQGTTGQAFSLYERLRNGLVALNHDFSLGPWKIIVLLIVLVFITLRIRKTEVMSLYFSLLAASAIIFSYWFFVSKGWPRYAVIPILFCGLSLAVSFLELRWKESLAVLFVLAMILVPGIKNMACALNNADHGLFFKNTQSIERMEVVKILQREMSGRETTVATQWWATAADVQYCLSDGVDIFRMDKISLVPNKRILCVWNRYFLSLPDKNMEVVFSEGKPLFDGKYYFISEIIL